MALYCVYMTVSHCNACDRQQGHWVTGVALRSRSLGFEGVTTVGMEEGPDMVAMQQLNNSTANSVLQCRC